MEEPPSQEFLASRHFSNRVDISTPADKSSSDLRHNPFEASCLHLRLSFFSHFYTFQTLIWSGTCVAPLPSCNSKRATNSFGGAAIAIRLARLGREGQHVRDLSRRCGAQHGDQSQLCTSRLG